MELYFSEADQKKNPSAVVTALKFYASSLKQNDEKFMITKSVYPSDDDIEADLTITKDGEHVTSKLNGVSIKSKIYFFIQLLEILFNLVFIKLFLFRSWKLFDIK